MISPSRATLVRVSTDLSESQKMVALRPEGNEVIGIKEKGLDGLLKIDKELASLGPA